MLGESTVSVNSASESSSQMHELCSMLLCPAETSISIDHRHSRNSPRRHHRREPVVHLAGNEFVVYPWCWIRSHSSRDKGTGHSSNQERHSASRGRNQDCVVGMDNVASPTRATSMEKRETREVIVDNIMRTRGDLPFYMWSYQRKYIHRESPRRRWPKLDSLPRSDLTTILDDRRPRLDHKNVRSWRALRLSLHLFPSFL